MDAASIQNPLVTEPDGPRLSVVIVNYNGWADVARLVSSLTDAPELIDGRCELVVVDNASEGPIPEELVSPPASVQILQRADNGGFAAGVNTGWRASRGPWILLLNPDVLADSALPGQVLRRIVSFESRRDLAPGIVGFGLRNPDGTPQPSVGIDPSLFRSLLGLFIPRRRRKYQADWKVSAGPVPWVTGACAGRSRRARRPGWDGRRLLFILRRSRSLPLGTSARPARGVRPVDRGRASPTAPEPSGQPQDANHHAAQQDAVLPQVPPALAVPGVVLGDRSGSEGPGSSGPLARPIGRTTCLGGDRTDGLRPAPGGHDPGDASP